MEAPRSLRAPGIYGLQRLMIDSPEDESAVVQVLCAFVPTHAPRPATPPKTMTSSPAHVRAAVTVLANRPHPHLHPLSLSGTLLGLDYADLRYADRGGADLHGANLSGANLTGANLHGADPGRRRGSGRRGPGRRRPARHGPAPRVPEPRGPGRREPARRGPGRREPARREPQRRRPDRRGRRDFTAAGSSTSDDWSSTAGGCDAAVSSPVSMTRHRGLGGGPPQRECHSTRACPPPTAR